MGIFHKNLVGVDLGSYSIKVVSLKGRPGSYRLEAAAARTINEGVEAFFGGEDGEGVAGAGGIALSERLARLLRAKGIHGRLAATALSGGSLFSRHLALPGMPARDMREAVRWELKKEATIPADDLVCDYIDYAPGPSRGRGRGGAEEAAKEKHPLLAFAARRSDVEGLMETFRRASLDLRVVDVVPAAILAAYDLSYDWEEGVNNAVLDIGQSRSTLAILKDREVKFTRELRFGSGDLTRALASALQVSDEEAEACKISHGLTGHAGPAGEPGGVEGAGGVAACGDAPEAPDRAATIEKTAEAAIEGLCSEIGRSVDYYKAQFRSGAVGRLYLSGGGALLRGIDDFVSNSLGIRCFVFDPLKRVKVPGGLDTGGDRALAPSLAVAVGLATRTT